MYDPRHDTPTPEQVAMAFRVMALLRDDAAEFAAAFGHPDPPLGDPPRAWTDDDVIQILQISNDQLTRLVGVTPPEEAVFGGTTRVNRRWLPDVAILLSWYGWACDTRAQARRGGGKRTAKPSRRTQLIAGSQSSNPRSPGHHERLRQMLRDGSGGPSERRATPRPGRHTETVRRLLREGPTTK